MERLTIRFGSCVGTTKTENMGSQEILQKLAKYEDLEERCIKETTWSLKELLYKWKVFYESIAELYNYRKLEEQGLLLRLPCKVGTEVWEVEKLFYIDRKSCKECIYFGNDGLGDYCDYCEDDYPACTKIVSRKFAMWKLEAFGETVFLTKEEAEAALEKMKGEEHDSPVKN